MTEQPNKATIEKAARLIWGAAERMEEFGASKSDVAIGIAIAALGLMREDIGAVATIEWLRTTADLQEAALLSPDGDPNRG